MYDNRVNHFLEHPTHFNFKNKLGMRVGRLVAVAYAGKDKHGHRWMCICDCGNYKLVSGVNFSSKKQSVTSCGCKYADPYVVSQDVIKERVDRAHQNTPYVVVDYLDGKYNTKWVFGCKDHGEFRSHFGNVTNKHTGCPMCCRYGFQRDRVGYFYIMAVSQENDVFAYKVGITNQKPEKRAYQINRKSTHRVCNTWSFKFGSGEGALELERYVLDNFSERFIDKEDMKVGYTETIRPSNLPQVLRIASHACYKQSSKKLRS